MVHKRASLSSITMRDFRNIEELRVELPEAGMVIVGDNGQGKSNFLEAIYYLHLLRSVRGARDADVIRFGATAFFISAEAQQTNNASVSAGFERHGKKKRVKLDGAEPERLSDALGAVPSVLISPADVDLVAGAPSARRRYLDILLALSYRGYLHALQRYRHALSQRNASLRDYARGGGSGFDDRIAVWDAPLAEFGAALWTARAHWAASVAEKFARTCAEIGERAAAVMRYVSALEPASHDVGEVKAAIMSGHQQRRMLDVKRGITHTGPHRDDLVLSLGGKELRTFASAGQQRTAAIALRLLERDTLAGQLGVQPLLLLDDPFAELDITRSARILEMLARDGTGQTILVVPKETDIPESLTTLSRWRIEAGVLTGTTS